MAEDNFAAVRERIDPVARIEALTKAKVKTSSPGDVRLVPCPFCGSKTGFSVNPQPKTYCCHPAGCGAQGAVFTFVKAVRGFTRNHDALKFLAERVGYDLPAARPLGDTCLAAILKLAHEMKTAAADYYAARLWDRRDEEFTYTRAGEKHATPVLGYQTNMRGHSEGVLKYMRVGWSDGKLLDHLKARYRDHPDRKLAFAAMIASGLVKRTASSFRDRFRPGGYIYPVTDAGTVITLTVKYPDDGTANYQLPRTEEVDGQEVSVWGTRFYFLNHDALGADDLVLVEGEDDLLSMMDLAGYASVCGLRGTPNKQQIAALAERRRGKRTYLCLDNDDAGREIAARLWKIFSGPDYRARVLSWPGPSAPADTDEGESALASDREGQPQP